MSGNLNLIKKISGFFNGKTFAALALAVCLTTAVLVFFRTANWEKYYAEYAQSGKGSFPNSVGGLNFFAYFTEITVCVFTFFLTARAIYKLREKNGGAAVSCGVENAEAYEKNGDTEPSNSDKNSLDFIYSGEKIHGAEPPSACGLSEKNGGVNPPNSNKKDGKIRRFLSAASLKTERLIENPNVNCALATYAAVGFVVVSVGEACGVMTRYADEFIMLNFGNIWMHFVVFPLFAASAIFRKADKRAETTKLPLYLVFPLVYFVLSMLRGAVIEWYPYPFLNPAAIYGMVLPNRAFDPAVAGILIAATALIFAAVIASGGFWIVKLYNRIAANRSEKSDKF